MQLVVHELESVLEQEITVGGQHMQITAIGPHLLLNDCAEGTLKVQIADEGGDVVAESGTLDLGDIALDHPYAHGYVRFHISAVLKAGETYRVRLVAGGGYVALPESYVGWCNDSDSRKVDTAYEPSQGVYAAFDMELWGESFVTRAVS